MIPLPYFVEREDALNALKGPEKPSEALLALIVAELARESPNREIRVITGIKQVYTVSHLKRAGKTLTHEQLELWHNNPKRITLTHVRALCRMRSQQREQMLRKLLSTKMTSAELEAIAAKRQTSDLGNESDLDRYARKMGEVTGRVVSLSYRPALQSGKITLSWQGYDDLDELSLNLGFDSSEYI